MNVTDNNLGLRQRKQLSLKRRLQEIALDLFEERGFEAVTIDEIAEAAEVSAQTVYRHFSTKEGLVLWDEYDPMVASAVAERLLHEPMVSAVVGGLRDGLARVYARDAARILRRARLVRSVDAIRSANAALLMQMRQGLAQVLTRAGVARSPLEANVFAGATVGAFEAAADQWVLEKGKVPLARILKRAFSHLERIGTARSRSLRATRA